MACNSRNGRATIAGGNTRTGDSLKIIRLTDAGDSIYATKSGLKAFEDAMLYFDSAHTLALQFNDNFLLGQTTFAKGSVYNAWNREPQKTIDLFQEAAAYFHRDVRYFEKEYYLHYLVAHAYDNEKGRDSGRCIAALQKIYDTLIKLPDTLRAKLRFIPDLAWVSHNINNYDFAQQILNNLYERNWIRNDPETNNYLDHYHLTRAGIDVYKYRNYNSVYLDSLQLVFDSSKNIVDSLYYSDKLISLHVTAGNYKPAYYYTHLNSAMQSQLQNAAGIGSLKNRLLSLELQDEKRKQELEESRQAGRTSLIWILCTALAVISTLLSVFYRQQKKYKSLSLQLAAANTALDGKVNEVKLANTEMQHRIKNNLQMISSLVDMQERQASSDETIRNLSNIRNRIENIAALHRHLTAQKSNGDGHIHLKEYIEHLISSVTALLDNGYRVVTHPDVDDVPLSSTQIFPLGLILNEWVTNSVKYARVQNSILEINIRIKKTGDVVLTEYRDSGAPIPEAAVRRGLGMRITDLLTAQLNGTLTHESGHFFAYRLTIPLHGK